MPIDMEKMVKQVVGLEGIRYKKEVQCQICGQWVPEEYCEGTMCVACEERWWDATMENMDTDEDEKRRLTDGDGNEV